jgi:hypothetical protein
MAVAILESWGYAVATAGKATQRLPDGRTLTRQHDLFGCIDLVATRRNCAPLFVQVGGKDKMRRKERDGLAFARDSTSPDCATVEVWGFVEGRRPAGQRFRRTQWNGLEWAECLDAVCLPARPAATAGEGETASEQRGQKPRPRDSDSTHTLAVVKTT